MAARKIDDPFMLAVESSFDDAMYNFFERVAGTASVMKLEDAKVAERLESSYGPEVSSAWVEYLSVRDSA